MRDAPLALARVDRIGARGRAEQPAHPGGVGARPGGQYEPLPEAWLTEAASRFGRRQCHVFKKKALTKTVDAAWRAVPSLIAGRAIFENTGARAPPRIMTLGLRDLGSKTLSQKISDQRLTRQTDIDGTDFLVKQMWAYNYNNECDRQRRSQPPERVEPAFLRFSDRMAHRGGHPRSQKVGRPHIHRVGAW